MNHHDGTHAHRGLLSHPLSFAFSAGLGLQILQQLAGINTVMYYTPAILELAGFRDKRSALLIAMLPAAGARRSVTAWGIAPHARVCSRCSACDTNHTRVVAIESAELSRHALSPAYLLAAAERSGAFPHWVLLAPTPCLRVLARNYKPRYGLSASALSSLQSGYPLINLLPMRAVNALGTLVGMWSIDRSGRRCASSCSDFRTKGHSLIECGIAEYPCDSLQG